MSSWSYINLTDYIIEDTTPLLTNINNATF